MNNANFGRTEIIAVIIAVCLTALTLGAYFVRSRAQAQERAQQAAEQEQAALQQAEGAETATEDDAAAAEAEEAARKQAEEEAAKKQAEEEAAKKAEEEAARAQQEQEAAEKEQQERAAAEQERLRGEAQRAISQMSLEDKVSRLFIVTPEALTGVDVATVAGDMTRRALEQYPVGGIFYSAQNFENPGQFTELLTGTEEMSSYPIFLAVQEGVLPADLPADFPETAAMEDLLDQLGAEGVTVTDPLSAGNAANSADAAVAAIEGGADLLLAPQDLAAARQSIIDAVRNGRLTEERIDESLVRIYIARQK